MIAPRQPSDLFGPLFHAVQERGIFSDSKTFADADPCRAPADILADWHARGPMGDAELRRFVGENFDIPGELRLDAPHGDDLAGHISALWPCLTRSPSAAPPGSSLLPLPRPYVVPGGRFRELYYWDSFFTMLGLARSGRQDLVEEMVTNFGSLIDRYGHIPNGTRSYYLSRSHPPLFYLMAGLSHDRAPAARRLRLQRMHAEHSFWMAGETTLKPGEEHRRVVHLPDGALLNRYWDDLAGPRDESWREDVALARSAPDRPAAQLWRDLRAAAESGWDFSSRWMADGRSLATIRTTRLLPIDLNALLFGMEKYIAQEAEELGERALAFAFARRAVARRQAIDRHLWHRAGQHYADYDLDAGTARAQVTAALGFPLFTGVARGRRAATTAAALGRLVHAGGLATTDCRTGEQWDSPNGWAPLNWIAVQGLRACGETALASRIASAWIAMVDAHYRATGQLLEKYNVERRTGGGGGEYGLEVGFGWTNGVTLDLMRG